MRRIETQSELEKKKKRNIAILSIIMLGLLILSTVGYAFVSNFNSDNSNPSDIERLPSDKISFEYLGTQVNLLSSYDEVSNVSVESSLDIENFKSGTIYIDASNEGIYRELAIYLGLISPRVQQACYGRCEKNYPEKNCTSNLIVWREAPDNRIYQLDNCLFLEGDIRSADALIYKLFGSPEL